MADYNILKAVEYDKTSAAWRKTHAFDELLSLGWWLQPKYDGCFGMAVMKPDHSESRMLSRTGEDYTKSCQHILDEIRACCEATGTLPIDDGFVVLGEVWHPTDKFPKISGDFRRQRPSPHLCFVANDLLDARLVTNLVYHQRYEDLRILIGHPSLDEFIKVTTVGFDALRLSGDPLKLALAYKTLGGYDGAILRDPNAGYTIGDAKLGQIIKVKPVMSLDLPIVDIKTVPGEKTGRDVWSIEVEYRGVRTWVGSGMPHGDPVPGGYLYSAQNPVIAEIECMGLTEDGKLREPRFKGIRYDKVTTD